MITGMNGLAELADKQLLRHLGRNTRPIGKRPELQNALALLKPGDKLVVYKLDRLVRSIKDLFVIIERLEQRGADFQRLTEVIDTASSAGRVILPNDGRIRRIRALAYPRTINRGSARSKGHEEQSSADNAHYRSTAKRISSNVIWTVKPTCDNSPKKSISTNQAQNEPFIAPLSRLAARST